MFDIVPISYYTPLYYYILLLVVSFTLVHTFSLSLVNTKTKIYNNIIGVLVFVFVLLYMGLRPIHRVFTDMTTYANQFERVKQAITIPDSFNDPLFGAFIFLSSKVVSVNVFFLLCAVLYVVPLYLVCKKWFKSYWFYGFLFLISAFSFWAYGTNGIRNGIAGSLFLLGISREKRIWQILWIIIAVNFHKTMLLPAVGFLLANFYNHPKNLIVFWVLCIPISLLSGGFFENIFSTIGFDDDRLSYFTGDIGSDRFSSTGFRWDFLTYSATAIFAGWYYIIKREYTDKVYFWLFNTYVFANAFWILVIRANYSNRFAYLSWFMIGLVIIYPLLKQNIISKQHIKIGYILIAYFAFTFLMNVILA